MLLVLTVIASDTLTVLRHIPLWVGMLLNAVIGYVAFSVVHDSVHRAVSTNVKFNDIVCSIGLNLVAPYTTIKLFRWGHILHHRFASGPRDPDIVLHGPWWSLPFRWISIDAIYLVHALRSEDKVARNALKEAWPKVALVLLVIATLVVAGYGKEVLLLWLLPSRLIFLSLGFTFFWLPHVPHDTTQEENFTRATTMRLGYEWLFNPLLQYQNAHLIHHIFPMTPFYNNMKVWNLIEPELRHKDLAIQHGFAIRPTICPGDSADT
ncbi:MAG: fatty acid desaturase [Pseudoxanthomonas sp.]